MPENGRGKSMNQYLKKLFGLKSPYGIGQSNSFFLSAMQDSVTHFYEQSDAYRRICGRETFTPDQLQTVDDLERIPVIPTLYLKRNDISIPHPKAIEVTSSGTSGQVSRVRYSTGEILQMAKMAIRLGREHRLFSVKPVHYIILGYQPTRDNPMVISKTAYLSTWYAPGRSRTYALCYKKKKGQEKGEYELDLNGVFQKILECNRKGQQVRVIGFPFYSYFLLQKMKAEGITCRLAADTCALLGGGWKQFAGMEISKAELASLFEEILGIPSDQIHEFFGAAEHPILYCTCPNGHFHIPVYSRVLIRDVTTQKPLAKGKAGLVNLLTPMTASIPLMSIMTDDLGIVREGKTCGCGIEADYLEILGRTGVQGVKTCSAGAQEYWNGMGSTTTEKEDICF